MKKIIVAVDGYASTGKSSFSKKIAKEIDYTYIDTGAMYRAVTLFAIRNQFIEGGQVNVPSLVLALDKIEIDFHYNAETGNSETVLNGINIEDDIRTQQIGDLVSAVSRIKEVRAKLVELQKSMGRQKAIVMDGRDIGTQVFPEAELKVFMTAERHVRAERRFKELSETNKIISLAEVEESLAVRDYADENRVNSPLRKADDAYILDNTLMTIDDQMAWFLQLYQRIAQD